MNILKKFHRILCSLGINLLLISNIRYIHVFIRDYIEFKKLSHIDHILPVLGEHKEKSSKIIKHYFNQDLLVASYIFKKKNINKIDKSLINYCDSLSCLHTLEHFGSGRYGDKIDPVGHIKGFQNLVKMLKKNGILYISFPISNVSKIKKKINYSCGIYI